MLNTHLHHLQFYQKKQLYFIFISVLNTPNMFLTITKCSKSNCKYDIWDVTSIPLIVDNKNEKI
jgi:hypothetical protein